MFPLTLRPVQPDDESFLYRLYAGTRAEELQAWGWDAAQQDMFLRFQFMAQQHHYSDAYPDSDHRIICRDSLAVGRIMIWRSATEIRLVDISLLPEYRNRGIGTSLIEGLLAEGAYTNKAVTLHVISNSPALHLYLRLGLSVVQDDPPYLFMEKKPSTPEQNEC